MGMSYTLAEKRQFFGLGAARRRLLVAAALLAVAAVACLPLLGASSASAAPLAISQCNGTDNSTNEAVECSVVVTNTVNVATGAKSSSTVVSECHGFAGAEPTCVPAGPPIETNDVVLSVTQCNTSGNGTGSTVICRVDVINNIEGTATPQSVTVNQCQTSGAGGGAFVNCSSDESTDPSTATVIQCNQSGNGGGSGVTCTVGGGSTASVIPTRVNQCVGSGNGGGAFVTCSTTFTTNIVPVTDDGEGDGDGDGGEGDGGETGGETGGGTGGETGGETGGGTDGGAGTPGTPGNPGTPGTPVNPGTFGTPQGSGFGSSAGTLANTGMPVENMLLGGASVLLLGLVVAALGRRLHTVKR